MATEGVESMRVLLVDDHARLRALVRRELEQTGCCEVVGEAARAEVAATAVETTAPDLVVMDWAMPGEDGVWATREVKTRFPSVEVVAYTSSDDPAVATAFLEAGALGHFDKSDLSELVQWIVARAGRGTPPEASTEGPAVRGGLPPLFQDEKPSAYPDGQ